MAASRSTPIGPLGRSLTAAAGSVKNLRTVAKECGEDMSTDDDLHAIVTGSDSTATHTCEPHYALHAAHWHPQSHSHIGL